MRISGHFLGTSGEIYSEKTVHTANLTTYPEKKKKVYFCAILKTQVAKRIVYARRKYMVQLPVYLQSFLGEKFFRKYRAFLQHI